MYDLNTTFTAIPCLGCSDWRRDKALVWLGGFYLASLNGQKPAIPTRAQLLRGCCRSAELLGDDAAVDEGITFIVPKIHGRQPPEDLW
jgi:hypothetical protein